MICLVDCKKFTTQRDRTRAANKAHGYLTLWGPSLSLRLAHSFQNRMYFNGPNLTMLFNRWNDSRAK